MGGTYSSLSFITYAKMNSNSFQSLFYFGVEGTGNNATRSIDLTIDANYSPPVLRVNLNYDHGSVEYQSFSLDTWVNVAGVFDGASQTLSLYIDGILVGTSSTSVNSIIFSDSDPHKIGAGYSGSQQTTANYFNGNIDELSLDRKFGTIKYSKGFF